MVNQYRAEADQLVLNQLFGESVPITFRFYIIFLYVHFQDSLFYVSFYRALINGLFILPMIFTCAFKFRQICACYFIFSILFDIFSCVFICVTILLIILCAWLHDRFKTAFYCGVCVIILLQFFIILLRLIYLRINCLIILCEYIYRYFILILLRIPIALAWFTIESTTVF